MATIIKAGGVLMCLWKPRQYFNKLLFTMVFMSFTNFYVDHWIMRKAMRNVCLENTFTSPEQEHRNLYEFYFPNDHKITEIRKLSGAYFEYQKAHSEQGEGLIF